MSESQYDEFHAAHLPIDLHDRGVRQDSAATFASCLSSLQERSAPHRGLLARLDGVGLIA